MDDTRRPHSCHWRGRLPGRAGDSPPGPPTDPVVRPRHPAPRTAACRSLDTVGVPLDTPLRALLLTTTLRIAGLHPAACILTTPGCVRPLTGRHAGSLLTGWRGVRPMG